MGEGHGVRREEEREEERKEGGNGNRGLGGREQMGYLAGLGLGMGWGPPCRAEPIIRGWPYFWGYVACY